VTAAAVGDLVTVLPHKMDGGWRCGRWNGRVRSLCLISTDKVWVQELKVAGAEWELGMTTTCRIDHLIPIEIETDLFGNPAGGSR
jgi:hypothetical protein